MNRRTLIITGLAAVILTGCQKQDVVTDAPTPENQDYVLANLVMSLPASSAGTRLDQNVVQIGGSNFRGVRDMFFIPFTKQGVIETDDEPSYSEKANSPQLLTNPPANERFYFYNKLHLNYGVASFLTYGHAPNHVPEKPNGIDGKVFYGSMRAVVDMDGTVTKTVGIPEGVFVSPSNMKFELEPIYDSDDAPIQGDAIARYLTYIANAVSADGAYSWKNATNVWLKARYDNFINHLNGEYKDIAGSAANIMAYVNELYQELDTHDYQNNLTDAAIAEGVKKRIKTYTRTFSSVDGRSLRVTWNGTKVTSLGDCDNYPFTLHLPDGAAVLRWAQMDDGSYAFAPQTKTTTEDNISNIDSYSYPAELYYFTNSTIRTSSEDVLDSQLSSQSSWSDVMNSDLYTDGSVVRSTTKAVAIVDPLQYAVARLSATVQADTETLLDAASQAVTVGDQTFPVTGIIIGGQHTMMFDFTPKHDGDGDNQERYVYDSYLKKISGDSIYLTTAVPTESDAFETLVLQTQNHENITVVLELRNNSDKDFKGKSGIVYRGTKFYLAGKLKLDSPDDNKDFTKRVFTRDYTTKAAMKVTTLANAYNVMPDIQAERLEMSVQIDLRWMQATPSTIELTEEGDED